jgi:hypothetical protein
MNNREPLQDAFAEIATMAPVPLRPGLAQPSRALAPETPLPLRSGSTAFSRPLSQKIQTAEELSAALEEMRARMSPFLADLAPALPATRARFSLDTFQWRIEQPADRARFDEALAGRGDWETVTIPHYGPPLGKAATLYRATFDLPAEVVRRDCVALRFAGVDYKCQVYLNDVCVGQHEGFFDEFEFNCTGVARAQGNVLVVRVENDFTMLGSHETGQAVNGDKIYAATGLGYDDPVLGWHHCPAGMGIYNRVVMEGRAHMQIGDLWVRPLVDQKAVEIRVEVENQGQDPSEDIAVLVSVFGQNFEAVVHRDAVHHAVGKTVRGFGDLDGDHAEEIPARMGLGRNYLAIRLPLPDARLWDLDAPWLYQAQVKLLDAGGALLDVRKQQFGMRTFAQDEHSNPKGKFFLNGREIRLRGANTMGHLERCVMKGDFGQLRDDILLAKLTNMNFLRLTQRPVHKEVYEWCDRLGLMLQTDMPMFATVRRNQLLEIVRQSSLMERHVRAHPSSILVSFINEPRPAAASQPHRFLERPEIERMFRLSTEAVQQENPDRVCKCVDGDYDPPATIGMPDNHCYCGWYIGHGVDLGALHRGDWMPVKPGWHYGCGEFGAEGLDSYGVMNRYYPPAWKPASPDAPWTPKIISKSQSWNFHYLWYETPRTAREWIEASQQHQAWITRFMTEAFRRKSDMNTFAIHLFIDAWPCGWMKSIMDVDRVPKQAWFEYRDALAPLAVSLRSDRMQVWSGETVPVELWICNDREGVPAGCRVLYDVRWQGKVIAQGEVPASIEACAPRGQGVIPMAIPETADRGQIELGATLIAPDGSALHDTVLTLKVFPKPLSKEIQVWLPRRTPLLEKVVGGLGLEILTQPPEEKGVLLIASPADYLQRAQWIDAAVRQGATAVFLNLPVGEYQLGGVKLNALKAGMGPRHFVSRATGHPLVEGFQPDDFKFWHFDTLGHGAPLLHTVLEGSDWTPVLQSGDGGWLRPWGYTPAAVERRDGNGRWIVCQIELAHCVATNPAAHLFTRRLLAGPALNQKDGKRGVPVVAGKNGGGPGMFAEIHA